MRSCQRNVRKGDSAVGTVNCGAVNAKADEEERESELGFIYSKGGRT